MSDDGHCGGDAWIVRRSRLPDLLAAAMLLASGAAGMAVGVGALWWMGMACSGCGLALLIRACKRPSQRVRLRVGDAFRLESLTGKLLAEGRLDGGSVVTPWLMALRIRSDRGQRLADLVLDPWSASPDDLRRLRVRLLGDETLRA